MGLTVAAGLVIFVLPKFRDLFTEFHAKIPGLAAFLLDFSAFVSDHGIPILVSILVAVLGGGVLLRTDPGRMQVAQTLLKLPVIAPMMRAVAIERFSRALGAMLFAGVPGGNTLGAFTSGTHN